MKLVSLVEAALTLGEEYWYSSDGELIHADGNTGEYDHEAVVIKTIIDLMCDVLGVENIWDCDRQYFRVSLSDAPSLSGALNVAFKKAASKAGFKGDLWDFEIYDWIMAELVKSGHSQDEVKGMSMVLNDRMDGREFSITHWGWIRIAQNNMELPNLLPATLKRAGYAFEEALIESGEDVSDDDLMGTEVTVSTYTGKRKTVTLGNLQKGVLDGDDADLQNLNVAASAAVRNMNVKSQPSFYGDHLGD